MTDDEKPTGEWRREELRPARGFHLPRLALAGVVATIAAATILVAGIGDLLRDEDPPDRLLPLQAASPPEKSEPKEEEDESSSPPPSSQQPERPRLYDALLRLRFAVGQGVERGDVRDDVGLDLTNVIGQILDRPWSEQDERREDVDGLHHKISTRAREGGIDHDLAGEFHLILERATG